MQTAKILVLIAALAFSAQAQVMIPSAQCEQIAISWECIVAEAPPVEPEPPAPVFPGLQSLPELVEVELLDKEAPGEWTEYIPPQPDGEYRLEVSLTLDSEQQSGRGWRVCMRSRNPVSPYFCTAIRSGSGTFALLASSTLAGLTNPAIQIQAYNRPVGSVVAAKVRAIRIDRPAIELFVKYPNYRGALTGDTVLVNTSGETTAKLVSSSGVVLDETSGSGDMELDASEMGAWGVVRIPGWPDYVVERKTAPIDRDNRFLKEDGTPYIPIGVYDSGLPYLGETDPRWVTMLDERRRLSELKPDIYLNYHYGLAPADALKGLANAVAPGKYVQPAQCFAGGCNNYTLGNWPRAASPEFVGEMSNFWWGAYLADEPTLAGVRTTWEASTWFRQWPGFTLGVLMRPGEFAAWRDNLDVLGVDPYPIASAADVQDISLVANWVSRAREAVHDSRPIMAVLQFFKLVSVSRWPTQRELESMGLIAIAEGADGVLFWSVGNGAGALWSGSTCAADSVTWCPERVEYHNRLKGAFDLLRKVSPEPNETAFDNDQYKAVRKGSQLIVYNKTATAVQFSADGKTGSLGPYEAVLIQ